MLKFTHKNNKFVVIRCALSSSKCIKTRFRRRNSLVELTTLPKPLSTGRGDSPHIPLLHAFGVSISAPMASRFSGPQYSFLATPLQWLHAVQLYSAIFSYIFIGCVSRNGSISASASPAAVLMVPCSAYPLNVYIRSTRRTRKPGY